MNYIQISKTVLFTGCTGLFIVACTGCLCLYLYILSIKAERELYKKSHLFKKTYHLRKQGNLSWRGAYDLRSFDGGKNWWAVAGDEHQGIYILGRAEDIYPGILEDHAALSRIAIITTERGNSRLN